jgi:hypothetical protein
MPQFKHILLTVVIAMLLALALASCGGGSDSLTHIQGSSAKITKATLDHWMKSLVATDFRQNVGTKAPLGLVAEPADYPKCAEAAKKVIARDFTGKLKLSDAEISKKCHLLYQTVKAQALARLLSVQWTVLEGEEAGLKVSAAELQREFKRFSRESYGSPAGQRKYLAERGMSVADVLYQLKESMLVRRILPKFQARVAKAGGGERTYARLALVRYRGLIAKTTCKPGYVVLGCKEYREPAVALPSPSVILEGFAGAVG